MHASQSRVLIVDDELLVALGVAELVRQCGCAAVGPVGTVRDALDIIRETVLDGAVLDINLGNERVWPVAELLQLRGQPFVLASGYGRAEVARRFSNVPLVSKPLTVQTLMEAFLAVGTLRR